MDRFFFYSTLSTCEAPVVIFVTLSLLIYSSCRLGRWARFSAEKNKFSHHLPSIIAKCTGKVMMMITTTMTGSTLGPSLHSSSVSHSTEFESLASHLFPFLFYLFSFQMLPMIDWVVKKKNSRYNCIKSLYFFSHCAYFIRTNWTTASLPASSLYSDGWCIYWEFIQIYTNRAMKMCLSFYLNPGNFVWWVIYTITRIVSNLLSLTSSIPFIIKHCYWYGVLFFFLSPADQLHHQAEGSITFPIKSASISQGHLKQSLPFFLILSPSETLEMFYIHWYKFARCQVNRTNVQPFCFSTDVSSYTWLCLHHSGQLWWMPSSTDL